MSDIIVHLTISGLIALQPAPDLSDRWRVVVPDLNGHHHYAFILVSNEELEPPPPSGVVTVFPLIARTGKISGVTAVGTSNLPPELISLEEACFKPAGQCAEVKARAEFDEVPALELWIEDAGITSTWIDPKVKWSFERHHKGKKQVDLKQPDGLVAEEVCLTFKTPGPTFSLRLVDDTGDVKTIRLKPRAGSNTVELRLNNIEPGSSWDKVDDHFKAYYDVVKRHSKRDVARLTTSASKPSLPDDMTRPHRDQHRLSALEVKREDIHVDWVEARAAQNWTGFLGKFKILSVTGSNCPPVGDPYP